MNTITTVVLSTSTFTETILNSTTLTSVFPSTWTNLSTTTTTDLSTAISTNVYNTTTTTLLPIPVVGQLPLTANILGEAQGFVTFAIQDCTTPASSCVWVEPLTVTAGPSTAHIDGSNYWKALGQLDCKWDASGAEFTWTLGAYPSSELKGSDKGWVTTAAPSSVTLTLSDKSLLQNFVEVTVTKLITNIVTDVSTTIITQTLTNITTSTMTDISTSTYNVTTTEQTTVYNPETLTVSVSTANPDYWNDASRWTGTGASGAWRRAFGTAVLVLMALLFLL